MTANRLALVGLALVVLIIVAIAVLGLMFALRTGDRPNTQATVNAAGTNAQATRIAGAPTALVSTVAAPTQPPAPTPVSATATNTPPSPLPSFTPTPFARSNGSVIIAQRRNAPTIDGTVSDWTDLANVAEVAVFRPENWTGTGDLNVRYALAWDDSNLYVAATVTDDAFVQTQRGETIFRGDSLELLFDADLSGDFRNTSLNSDDFQIGLSPGNFAEVKSEAWLWFPRAIAGPPVNVLIAAQQTSLGYTLEAQIPWAVFGLRPEGGQRFGFALSASDNDAGGSAEQQSMVSSVTNRRLSDPTTWGTLELGR
jgi:hypothetical protein